ncbi:hypothetical protein [Spiroplasma endosymbiont of Glossina fuscipes fuscipes]|uniref:hypothetical protein n=1 Tax=Spiroplasma endosymbiont of Glossina fuscipes fuscipes TaxID=2004463 RepID=UPI003C716C5F
MAKKKLNETKQLQEVNNSLKMKVNETTVIKALTKAWKKSEPYLKLMTEYETLNATSTVDWDNRYEKEYEKFIKAVLGENVNFKKTTTKKASRPIEKIKATASKKSNMGLNPRQLDLLTKRKLYRSEDLFPARVVRGYQESQEAIESELKEPRESFLNNNINALAVDQKEKEVGLISTVNLTFETEDDNLAVENITGKSTPKEVEDLIRKLNPNQQRLIRQRNEQYGRYHSEREKNISEHHDEDTGEILKTFNNQVKEHAKSWGLNQNQIELLARRDATNHDEHLELLSRRDSHPSEWKQYMKEITLSKDDNEEKVVINPENVIKKRNQMVQESLSRSLGKTKKQIGGKYIRNFITDEPQRKPIFKTDLYLDTAITNQIRQLFVKAIQKPKPKVLSKFATTNVMSNPANTSFSAPSSNNLTQLNGAAKESTPSKTTVLPAMSPQEKYISTVDSKKRPNLKKTKIW